MAKKKEFTEKQKERLADEGYWLESLKGFNDNSPSAICIKNGQCKYIHWDWGTKWCTLLWSCAPTKKQVSKKNNETIYKHYKTFEEMMEANPQFVGTRYAVKAPNDY